LKIVHASPGFGSKFSEEQTLDFLSKGKLNLLLGTIDEKDEPNVHPVWYLFENENSTSKHLRHQKKQIMRGKKTCLFLYR